MSEKEEPKEDQKVENLNFSFQDILGDDEVNTNNPSFQSIVQTFRNEDNQSASYNNLPAELQHLFSLSDSNASSDISMWNNNDAVSSPHSAVSTPTTNQQPPHFITQSPLKDPTSSPAQSPLAPVQSSPSVASPAPQTMTPQQNTMSPSPQVTARPSPTTHQSPVVIAPQQHIQPIMPQQQQQQQIQPQSTNNTQQNTGGAATSMTLLDNLTAQLSPDRKERFIELFRQLQSNDVTANEFLAQARMLLDQQQYQQLENLKSKQSQPAKSPAQPQQILNKPKRPMNSSQVRAEDAQRAMSGLIAPQAKRSRTADIPISASQPLPLYKATTPPVQQHTLQQKQQMHLQQQQLMQQQQQQQMKQHLLQQHQQQQQNQLLQQQQQQLQQQQLQQQQLQQQQQQQQQMLQQQQHQLQEQPLPIQIQNNIDPSISNENEEVPSTTQDFMNPGMLKEIITKITSSQNLKLELDVVTLIALATQDRIQNLIRQMVIASKHRVDSQTFTQPGPDEKGNQPFKIVDVQDIKKQLLAIERVEREEERKRKEIISERERKAQLGEEANDGGDEDKPSKKKKKKDMGPGVTARYMSDDVRNKTTNETALMIAGGVMKSWMLTGMTPTKEKSQPLPRQNSNLQEIPLPSSSNITPINTTILDNSPAPFITSPTNQSFNDPGTPLDDQPRGRGRPRRRKSGSGSDLLLAKKPKNYIGRAQDGGLFLPPSTIGRPHRLGEQGARKITVRDALFVLEDEYENKRQKARRTLVKSYSKYLK